MSHQQRLSREERAERAQQAMRATIDLLLALPEDERSNMERAESVEFTMAAPAPQRQLPPQAEAEGAETAKATLQMLSVEACLLLCAAGLRPALLNFAHSYNCGGGFEHANGSQEEDIFRKTSLFLSLWPHRRADDGPGVLKRGMWIGEYDAALARKEPFYPHAECGAIYSPHVRPVRDLDAPSLPTLPRENVAEAPVFGVLTVAAQDCGREPPFREDLLREKLRTTLHLAASHGHDALLLGAFGCGYFRNPPEKVAAMFGSLLDTEFKGVFRAAVFAVPDAEGPNIDEFASRFDRHTRESLMELLAARQQGAP